MQTIRRVRQNLSVEVRFLEDGQMVPLRIRAGDRVYAVDRVSGCRRHAPEGVASVAPTEYTVIVEGILKRLYYEADSNTWFSVRMSFSDEK
ncbi:MAG: hypothetical protein ACI3XR_03885 [Eubacteriales bacterium]